jgi:hypothetical protein
MAATTRKDITDDLLYRMGLISALETVTFWRDTDSEPYEPSECPALNIKSTNAIITHNVSDDEHELKVLLELHTTSRIAVSDVESILGDIAAQVETNNTWGGHADGTNIENHEIDINQTGDVITAATLNIIVNYTTAKGKI